LWSAFNTPKPIENNDYAPIKTAYNLQGGGFKKYEKKSKYTSFEMVLIIIIIIILYYLVIRDLKLC
tara:strand:- start:3830 stop:4027 length:198 start_codon:yes stop_codon:yes gene_type:complete